ncbi:MAG: hypothetical protein QM679_03115 [Patulibacter sp.]
MSRRTALHGTAVLAAFLAVVLIPRESGGVWAPAVDPDHPNRVVGRWLIALFAGLAVLYGPALARKMGRIGIIAGAVWSTWLGFALVALWPGTVEPDSLNLVFQTLNGTMNSWWSTTYAVVFSGLFDLHPHIWVVAVFQSACVAAAMTYFTVIVWNHSKTKRPVFVLFAIGLLSAPLFAYSVQQTRDTIFGVAISVAAVRVGQLVARRRGPSFFELPALALLFTIAVSMRKDAMVLIPFLLWALWRFPAPAPHLRRTATVTVLLVAALIPFKILPQTTERVDFGRQYFLINFLNPLSDVLNGPWWSPHREQDLATLGKVVKLDKLTPAFSVDVVPAYWNGAYDAGVSQSTWNGFRRVTLRILLTNPGLYVGSQLRRTLPALNWSAGSENGATAFILEDWRERSTVVKYPPNVIAATRGRPPSVALYHRVSSLLHRTNTFTGPFPRGAFLHYNGGVILLILLAPLWLMRDRDRRSNPALLIAAVAAAFALARFPVVVAGAPVAQFRYLIALHFTALVVLPLLYAAWEGRHASQSRPSADVEAANLPEPS